MVCAYMYGIVDVPRYQVPGSAPIHAVFLNVLYDPEATGIASTGFFRLEYLDQSDKQTKSGEVRCRRGEYVRKSASTTKYVHISESLTP